MSKSDYLCIVTLLVSGIISLSLGLVEMEKAQPSCNKGGIECFKKTINPPPECVALHCNKCFYKVDDYQGVCESTTNGEPIWAILVLLGSILLLLAFLLGMAKFDYSKCRYCKAKLRVEIDDHQGPQSIILVEKDES